MHTRAIPLLRLSRRAFTTPISRTQSRTLARLSTRTDQPISIQARASRALSTTHLNLASTPMAAPTDTAAAQEASSSGITPDSLTSTLRSKFNASHVDIEDMSGGCGQAFNAVIVSKEFDGKTLLQRHRLVNNALKDEIKAIHAWTPRCLTEKQWDEERARSG